jgi:hypothetical protein
VGEGEREGELEREFNLFEVIYLWLKKKTCTNIQVKKKSHTFFLHVFSVREDVSEHVCMYVGVCVCGDNLQELVDMCLYSLNILPGIRIKYFSKRQYIQVHVKLDSMLH